MKIEVDYNKIKRLFKNESELLGEASCPDCGSILKLRCSFEYKPYFSVSFCEVCKDDIEVINSDEIRWSIDFTVENIEDIKIRKYKD